MPQRKSSRSKSAAKSRKPAPRRPRAAEKPDGLSPRQWDLPAGIRRDGSGYCSLRDLVSGGVDSMLLEELTESQQAELTAERIRNQRSFRIAMVGVGVVDKRRALKELRAGSDTGRTLVEIEKRMLKRIVVKARNAMNQDGRSR